jgi:hypothetical protein
MSSSQPRSVRPLSRPLRPPRPHPACGALLVSLDFYKIVPIGAAAELQDIGGQRREAAMGMLSSRTVCDLLVYVFPSGIHVSLRPFAFFSSVPFLLLTSCTGRLSRSFVLSTCRPPVAATLRPRRVCAHNRSLHVVPAAAHCSNARKRVAQEQGDRCSSTPDPIGPLPRLPCPPRGVRYATNRCYITPFQCSSLTPPFHLAAPTFHPTFPPRCTTHPVCSGPPTSTLLANTFMCQRS